MLPYIYVFGIKISMYALSTLIGVALSLIYLKLQTRRDPAGEADCQLCLVYSLVGAAAGAKLLYLFTRFDEFISEFPYLFSVPALFLQKYLYGGFVFYGGLFGCLLASWLFCRAVRRNWFEMLRVLMPIFPLIHGFGRLGCFCAGCCYGVETASALGVVFHHSEYAPNGIPLLPVQLMEAFGEFVLFGLTAAASARRWEGRVILGLYLIAYSILRFILEFYRGDDYRGFIGVLSISQLIALLAALLGLILLLLRSRKAPEPDAL